MAWVDIKTWTFTPLKDLTVHLQYDNTSKTFTSVKVRVILTYPSGWGSTSYSSDAYFLLWGDPASNKIYNIKAPGVTWGNATPDQITVEKAHSATNFTIPSFWVCCSGHMLPDSSGYLQYGDGKGGVIRDTAYNWFKSGGRGRSNYKITCASQSLTGNYWIALNKPAAPDAPTDNYNNTFNASCSEVASPTGNPTTTTLQYKFGANGTWQDAGSRVLQNKPHGASAGSATQTVYVRVCAKPTYGDPVYSDASSTAIKNYVPPAIPEEAPTVTITKTRPTVKEPWVFSWSGEGQQSEQINSSSSIAGYRIVLSVKKHDEPDWKSVQINNSAGEVISKNPVSATLHTVDTIDLPDTTAHGRNTITIYPDKQGFVPGDQVRVGIRPYILWGAKNPTHYGSASNTYKLFNEEEDEYRHTEEITVQNAGVVRIKTGSDRTSYKEGIVFIKTSSGWKEADVVKVKTSSGWKESE